MTSPFVCPVCGNTKSVPAYGRNKSSPILLVSDRPGKEETNKGIPMCGNMGNVIKVEFGRLGIDFDQFRRMNLWHHEPNDNPECLKHGLQQVIDEAKGKQAILLLGSDVVGYLCNEKVSDVCGLQVRSPYLSAPIIVACINPASVFHADGALGEVRLAFKKFSELIKGLL